MNDRDREEMRRYAQWLETASDVELAQEGLRHMKGAAVALAVIAIIVCILAILDPRAGAFAVIVLASIALGAPFMVLDWKKDRKTVRDAA